MPYFPGQPSTSLSLSATCVRRALAIKLHLEQEDSYFPKARQEKGLEIINPEPLLKTATDTYAFRMLLQKLPRVSAKYFG